MDFIIGDHTAVELKATGNASPADLKGLRALAEEERPKRYMLICLEGRPRQVGIVEIQPLTHFLAALSNGELDSPPAP